MNFYAESEFKIKFFSVNSYGQYICKYCDYSADPVTLENCMNHLICHVLTYHCKVKL